VAELPETRYAKSGDAHIAFQVVGDGPVELVLVPTWITHVEAMWDQPAIARSLEALASFGRLTVYDQRGTGLSDPVSSRALPTLEQHMDDLRAVLAATGTERPALLGYEGGAWVAALFAATYPERTRALVTANAWARIHRAPDHPWGIDPDEFEGLVERLTSTWGVTPPGASLVAQRWARYQRQAASPGTYAALLRQGAEIDIRPVLGSIRVPTLVLVHREPVDALRRRHHGSPEADVGAAGRYMAQHIRGARYVETAADQPRPAGDLSVFVEETRAFLTGVREAPESDRVLSTVLFTDIVGSTEQAATVGDSGWKELLDAHDDMVRRQLERFRGREVKTLGDGFLATFDGPARAIRAACAIRDGAQRLGLEIRAGLHTGEIETRGTDVGGLAVHIAARVGALAEAADVLVSRTIVDLVAGSGIEFEDRGEHELKGLPGAWRLFAAKA
jgi:class 3 adenylate cyclase